MRRNGESRNIYPPLGFTSRLMRLDSFPPIYAVAQAIIWTLARNQFNVIFLRRWHCGPASQFSASTGTWVFNGALKHYNCPPETATFESEYRQLDN